MSGPGENLAIGIDVGGTKIAAGVIRATGEIVDRLLVPTPSESNGSNSILITLAKIVQRLRDRNPLAMAIGVGAAGMVEWPGGFIRWAPNNSYRQLPLRARLSELSGLPVIVDNDANVAAWAEYRFGNDAHCCNMLFLTVGTGVGGGLVLNGELYRGTSGIAGEIGHLIVDAEGGVGCGCGNTGCLEAVASGTALGRMGRDAAERDPTGELVRLAGSPENVDGRIVTQAARNGDQTACLLFDRLGSWLGIGIASLVNVLDFELIVVGGGLAVAGDLLLPPARTKCTQLVAGGEYRTTPRIKVARFGNEAGIVGAGALALDHHTHPAAVGLDDAQEAFRSCGGELEDTRVDGVSR